MNFISNSSQETERIAYEFALTLKGGEIITLDGDLGAGKTAFVRGMAKAFSITDNVSSPTFTIVNEYRNGIIPLFHFDVYRIGSSEEMYDIGWEDYISQDAVVVVEWAANIADIFEEEPVRIVINKDSLIGDNYREIIIGGNCDK